MFGLPGIGGGGLGGFFPIYLIMVVVNVIFKFFTGGLDDLFPTEMPM